MCGDRILLKANCVACLKSADFECEHLWLPLKVNGTCKPIAFLTEWLEIKDRWA